MELSAAPARVPAGGRLKPAEAGLAPVKSNWLFENAVVMKPGGLDARLRVISSCGAE